MKYRYPAGNPFSRFPLFEITPKRRFLLVPWLLFLLPLAARADMTYCYQGNNFTFVAGVYKTSDSIRGCVTLGAVLPEDSPRTFYSIVDLLFTDGEQTISLANPFSGGDFASFGTTGGNITSWDVHVVGINGDINTFHNIPLLPFTEDQVDMNMGNDFATVSTAGVWTTNPEPVSAVLLMTVLAAASLVTARRKHLQRRSSYL
ncbi:MAG TPA: hypothetical protein VMH28_12640 [Candidatus Acidoferrales bacterium]|nr:hypothetical protein [Candidatus Acidoferrales bacterium]